MSSSSSSSSNYAVPKPPSEKDKLNKGKPGSHDLNSFYVCGTEFHVDKKYALIKAIGQGAYGVVCSARVSADNGKESKVAIKKISKAFDHLTDCKRTLREIKILRHFKYHENIIYIQDILRPMSYEDFEDVYIVSELMDTDLHQIISSGQNLSDDHCQYFMYQILRGLKYIHSAQVLHRDLKPSNILLNGNCDLKICDFGLARSSVPNMHTNFMTEYVATRWYRAPEIMLSWKSYSKAIDIWSVGCIFYEILARKPLFPGRDYIHQLNLITDVLGTPSDETISSIASAKARAFMRSMPKKPPQSFYQKLPNANPAAIDLLEKMLKFDPDDRLTVEDALRHPYLESLHDPTDEPVMDVPFVFPWEDVQLSKEMLKELIYKEIVSYHPNASQDSTFHPVLPDVPGPQHV